MPNVSPIPETGHMSESHGIQPRGTRFWQRIRGQIILVLAVALIPTLLIQAYVFNEWYQSRREAELESNLQLARAVAKTFDRFIQDVLHQELAIGQALAMEKLTAKDRKRLIDLNFPDHPSLLNLLWISPDGIILDAHLGEVEGQSATDWKHIRDIMGGREWAVSDLVLAKIATKDPIISIARGIRDESGQLLGIVAASILSDRLGEVLAIERVSGGAVSLVDSTGRLVYRYPWINPAWEERNWIRDYPEYEQLFKGKEVAKVFFARFEGKNRLAAITPIASIGWAAGAGRTEEAAMHEVTSKLVPQVLFLFTITLSAFGAALLCSHFIISSIKKLRNHAMALASSDADGKASLSGPAEIRELASSFNQMVQSLKATEDGLRGSEERLRLLGNNLPDSAVYQYTHGPDGKVRFLYFSAGIERLNGLSVEEVLRDAGALHRQIPPEYFHRLVEAEAKSAREMTDFDMEVPMRLPDGEMRWMSLHSRPRRLPDGHTIWDGVQTDVTERKRTEESLASAHRQIQSIIDNTPAIIYAFDLEERFVLANTALAELLNSTPEKMIGKRRHEFMPKEDADWHEANDLQVVEAGRALEFEEYSQLEDRSITWLTAKFPLRDAQGRIVAVAGISSDISERKRMEEALLESEEKYRLLFNNMNQIMAVDELLYDERGRPADWRIFDVNPAYLHSSGKSRDEIIGRRLSEIYGAPAPEDCLSRFTHVVETGEPVKFEYYFEPLRMHMQIAAFPLGGPRLATVTSDITERKRMEEELRRSRDELELRVRERTAELEEVASRLREHAALLELAHDAILVRDMDDRIIYWNSGAERTYGWRKEEVLGRVIHDLLHTEFPKPLEEITAEVLGNLEWDGELLHRTRNGESILVASRWAIQRDQDGAPSGLLEINRDVTDRKQAEVALRENEKQYRMLVETINEGLAKYNEEFLFSYVNERFCEMLGYPVGELIGRPIAKVFNEVNQVKLQEQLDRRERGEKGSYEIEFLSKDGRSVPTIVSSSPVFDEHGKFKGGIATITDITARKQAEVALRESERQLKHLSSQLLKVQEDERARVACEIHDSVGQSLHALRSGVKNLSQQINEILCSSELEESLCDLLNVVDFSIEEVRAIYTGLRPLLLDDLGIVATVGWFIRECRKTYPDILIEGQIRIQEEDVPDSLKIVIFRLLQAAMDNIARHSKAETACVSLEKIDGKLEVRVVDNGTGFSLMEIALYSGEALGIAIMQERVESSGGIFSLRTAKGQGTAIRALWDLSKLAQ